jgi:hypothetical protein
MTKQKLSQGDYQKKEGEKKYSQMPEGYGIERCVVHDYEN